MSNELLMGKCISQKENQRVRGGTSQKITMILPACNEEASIGSLVLLSKLYVDNVIVIDDGSVDRTAEIAKKAGAEVITQGVKKGKGEALKTGFKAASDLGADIIVTMDSDGQHNPIDIPILVTPIIEGNAEMVNGSRYLNGLGKNSFYLPPCGPDSSGYYLSNQSTASRSLIPRVVSVPFLPLQKISSASVRRVWPSKVKCLKMLEKQASE